jgi:hypothetical protein
VSHSSKVDYSVPKQASITTLEAQLCNFDSVRYWPLGIGDTALSRLAVRSPPATKVTMYTCTSLNPQTLFFVVDSRVIK